MSTRGVRYNSIRSLENVDWSNSDIQASVPGAITLSIFVYYEWYNTVINIPG